MNSQRKKWQKGASPIIMASAIAVAGLTLIEGARFVADGNKQLSEMAADTLHMQGANESALEQLSQLLGATVLKPDDSVSQFVLGTGLDGANIDVSPSSTIGSWSLDGTGAFIVQNCISSSMGVQPAEVFGDDKGTEWLSEVNCQSDAFVTTTIVPTSLIDPENVTNARASGYLLVDAVSESGVGRKLIRSARLTLPAASVQCNENFDGEFCQTDHCPYMMPVKNRAGDVMFTRGEGDSLIPKLMPNPNYISDYRIPRGVLPMGLQERSILYTEDEERPTQMIQFLNQAFGPGRVNPFDGVQGIDGYLFSQMDENLVTDSDFIYISVPNNAGGLSGGDAPLRFEGFLQGSEIKNSRRVGAKARPWRAGTPFDDPSYAEDLKAACARSIRSPGADFCARMRLSYALDTYYYKGMRSCQYIGPPSRLVTDPSGARTWEVNNTKMTITDWKASDQTTAGFTVVNKDIQNFVDTEVHHDFDPESAQGFREMPHAFNDVSVGSVMTREVKWFPKSEEVKSVDEEVAGDALPVVGENDLVIEDEGELAEGEETSQGEWKERMITRVWEANCAVQELANGQNPPGFNPPINKMDMCFYVGYYNSGKRLEARAEDGNTGDMCRRELSAVRCRNLNGCFTADTPVMMADGTMRMISEVNVGDRVFNPATKTSSKVSEVISGPQERDMYRIMTDTGKAVSATWNHPFETPEGFFRAHQVSEGDQIRGAQGFWQTVKTVERIPLSEDHQVWNLSLEGSAFGTPEFVATHQFVANGLATGDYVIQQSNLDIVNEQLKSGDFHLEMSRQTLTEFPSDFEWAR
ncbi:MAG: Hint domain-containing protein [Oligoflexales bacterium]